MSTLNMELLESDDWLGKPENRVVVHCEAFLMQMQKAESEALTPV